MTNANVGTQHNPEETKTMEPCEKCGFEPAGFGLNDYCGICEATLCTNCMKLGHCNRVPALSGMAVDYEEADVLEPADIKAQIQQDRVERFALKAG